MKKFNEISSIEELVQRMNRLYENEPGAPVVYTLSVGNRFSAVAKFVKNGKAQNDNQATVYVSKSTHSGHGTFPYHFDIPQTKV